MKNFQVSSVSTLRAFFLAVALLFSCGFAAAQNNSGGFDDEDEEEEEGSGSQESAEEAVKYDEALILIDGKVFTVSPEIHVPREDTIDISVRRLQPNSNVAVHIKKGGVTVKKTGFLANEKGELDLEVRTGGKLSGNATVYYFASSGKRVQLDVKIIIE